MKIGFHHLHLRKRIYKNLEKDPHITKAKLFFDKLMYIVAIGAPLVMIPQVVEVFINKRVAGVSILTFFLFGVIDILWSIYGIIHKEKPIIISNVFLLILNFAIVFGVLLYS